MQDIANWKCLLSTAQVQLNNYGLAQSNLFWTNFQMYQSWGKMSNPNQDSNLEAQALHANIPLIVPLSLPGTWKCYECMYNRKQDKLARKMSNNEYLAPVIILL